METDGTAIVEKLIAVGANIDAKNVDQQTHLYIAATEGRATIVEKLLIAGANKDIHDIYKQTALFMAVCNGRTSIAHTLITAGADTNKRSKSGLSVKDVAIDECNTYIVDLLNNQSHG